MEDENGRGKVVANLFQGVYGVISASGDNSSDRQEGGALGITTIKIVTKFALRKQAAGIIPDQVLYRRIEYLVVDVVDYLDFGQGWVVATCTSDQIADPPVGRGR